jgi:hypothetical protein
LPPRKQAPTPTPIPTSRSSRPRKKPASKIVKTQPAAKRAVRKTAKPIPLKAMQQVRIGKHTYSLVSDPGCVICRHPARVQIEEQILLKTQYVVIAQMFSEKEYERATGEAETWPKITDKQVSEHFNADHCPIDAYVLNDLVEQAQQSMPEDYVRLGKRIIDGSVFAKYIVGKVEERVVRGDVEPTIKDGIAAARLDTALKIAKMRVDSSGAQDQPDLWYYEQSFHVFFTEAQRIMTEQQWSELMDVLRTNPVLRSLVDQRQQASEQATGELSA